MIKAGRYSGLDHISCAALNPNVVLLFHVEEQNDASPGRTGLLRKENWNQVPNQSWCRGNRPAHQDLLEGTRSAQNNPVYVGTSRR